MSAEHSKRPPVGQVVNYIGPRRQVYDRGVVTSWSNDSRIVFVRYDNQGPGAHGKATPVSRLRW